MTSYQVAKALCWGVLLSITLDAATYAVGSPQTEEDIDESIRVFNRGKHLHEQLRYEDAAKEYRAALKLDEGNPWIHNALGLALAGLGDFKAAVKAFDKALNLNPDLTDVYNNLGMAYAEMGDREKAFEAFSRVVRNPDYPTPEKALYNLGNLYMEDGNYELALMHFQRSIQKEPRFALGHRGLGKVHLLMGEVDAAIVEFEKALEISPEDPESLFQLARVHDQRGNLDEAIPYYRRVVELDRFSVLGRLSLERLDAIKSSN